MIKFKHIVKEDIKYYKRVYKKIENKFDMQGVKPRESYKETIRIYKILKKLILLDWKILCYANIRGIYQIW